MGIWQSESISLYLPTPLSHLAPKEARLDFFSTLRDLKFFSSCRCGRGSEISSFPGDEWYGRRTGSDEAKGREPESYQTLAGSTVTARHALLMEKGKPRSSTLSGCFHPYMESREMGDLKGGRRESGPSGDSTGVWWHVKMRNHEYNRPGLWLYF